MLHKMGSFVTVNKTELNWFGKMLAQDCVAHKPYEVVDTCDSGVLQVVIVDDAGYRINLALHEVTKA